EGHPCSTCHVTHARGSLGHGAHGKSTTQSMATFSSRQIQSFANFSSVTAEKCQLSVDAITSSVASFSHGLGGSSTTRSTTLRACTGRGGKERDVRTSMEEEIRAPCLYSRVHGPGSGPGHRVRSTPRTGHRRGRRGGREREPGQAQRAHLHGHQRG